MVVVVVVVVVVVLRLVVKGQLAVTVVVGAVCRSASSVTAFAAIAANAGSPGNRLFPTGPASTRWQRTRETPLVS